MEEAIHNVPAEIRTWEIDTGFETSCEQRLKAGERYVVIARAHAARPGFLSTGFCSLTFGLQGNEHILDALRVRFRGGPPVISGTVWQRAGSDLKPGLGGVLVTAVSGETRRQAVTDAAGRYQIRGLTPGRYAIELSKEGFAADPAFHRIAALIGRGPREISPDSKEPVAVLDKQASCQIWDLAMWSDGRISGVLRDVHRRPKAGITVAAIRLNQRGEWESTPLRSTVSGQSGIYTLDGLPEGKYVVAVSGRNLAALYRRDPASPGATTLAVADGQQIPDVDFVLPPRKVPVTVRVQVLEPGGDPLPAAVVTLTGAGKIFPSRATNPNGIAEFSVCADEHYKVEARGQRGRVSLRATGELRFAQPGSALTIVVEPQEK